MMKLNRYYILLVDMIFWQMIDNTDCERQTLIPNFAPGTSNLYYEVGGLPWSPRGYKVEFLIKEDRGGNSGCLKNYSNYRVLF